MSRQVAVRGRVPVAVVSAKKKTAFKIPRPPCLLHRFGCKAKQSVLGKYQPYCASHGKRTKGWRDKPAWKREARILNLHRWERFVEPPHADKGKH